MKLLGSTKSKITIDEICKNVPHLQITEVVLVHCNIVKINYHQIHESYIHLFLISR